MAAKILYFPTGTTKIGAWAREAHALKSKVNLVAAKVWVLRNVPKPFRNLITNDLMRT